MNELFLAFQYGTYINNQINLLKETGKTDNIRLEQAEDIKESIPNWSLTTITVNEEQVRLETVN